MRRSQLAAIVIVLLAPISGNAQSLDAVGLNGSQTPVAQSILVSGMGLTPCPTPKDGRCPDTVIMPVPDTFTLPNRETAYSQVEDGMPKAREFHINAWAFD